MNGCNIRLVQGDDRLTLGLRDSRRAFTLIEMLTVIAIIGILAAILVPTIAGVVGTAKRGALKLEVDELARAIERYRDKYGDYPPDGSDWGVFQRHIRKVFPQILSSEVDLLNPAGVKNAVSPPFHYCVRNSSDVLITTGNGYSVSELKVMDPAEALVFFLGGFSSDPKRPFTGRGGPFVAFGTTVNLQYNVSRENALYNFDAGRLTITSGVDGGTQVPVVSNDELFHDGLSANGGPAGTPDYDLFPVYLSKFVTLEESSPYVYFDSRTYVTAKHGGPYFNFYQRDRMDLQDASDLNKYGAVYPMYSETLNSAGKLTAGISTANGNVNTWAPFMATNKLFMKPTEFQVIGPGLDGKYGGRLIGEVRKGASPPNDEEMALSLSQTMMSFPSGNSLYSQYVTLKGLPIDNNAPNQPFRVNAAMNLIPNQSDPRYAVRMLDNVANFSAATLEAGTP